MTVTLASLHEGREEHMVDSRSSRKGKVQYDRDFGVISRGTNANHCRFLIISQGERSNMTMALASLHEGRMEIIVDSGSSRMGKVQYDRNLGVTPQGTSAKHGRFRIISPGKGPT